MKKQNIIALLTGLMLTVSVQAQIPKMPEPVTDGRPGIPAQTESWWAEWRKAQAAQEGRGGLVEDEDADDETNFYTGKPYDEDLGSYIFKYRNYSPSQMRWSAQDPSGFPDGANNYCYALNLPIMIIDDNGLTGKSVLWITVPNLFGNGNNSISVDGNTVTIFNYVNDFNERYNNLIKWMNDQDTATKNSSQPTNYLKDQDKFYKNIISPQTDLASLINGYTRVFIITHGGIDPSGNYVYQDASGNAQVMNFANFSNVSWVTCGAGTLSGISNGTGIVVDPNLAPISPNFSIDWATAMFMMIEQTKNILRE